jgi:NADPH-dependent F420 reductase
MRIAIIGTGRMGTALARRISAAGHDVRVGSRDPERGRRKAAETRANFGGSYDEAADGAEAVILAVPWSALFETLRLLGDLDGVILVDVTNPFTEGGSTEQYELPGSSGAEALQAMVPRARVVKAWNHLYSGIVRSSPDFGGTAATVFIAGDDAKAKEVVAELARDMGYDPADAGPLSSARYLERLAGLMRTLDRVSGGGVQHALKLLRRDRASS